MTPERWRDVQSIFEQVVDAPAERRADLLAGACGGDTALHAQVLALLDADHAQSSLLDQPPGHALGLVSPELVPGTRLDVYRIVRLLGAGGMGEVFLAERADGAPGPRVAIKVVRAPVAAAHVLAKLTREREILARLDHANIARLYGSGTTAAGRPYIVMEYVPGRRIDDHAELHGLSLRDRLRLAIDVCSAVESAHAAHVIHRDLKPDNVLVTHDGVVKLLDFGIAKVVDPASPTISLTDPRQRMVTPQYAAPEQLLGEPPAPTTDIHALGVLLYQLVAGRLPYSVAGVPPTKLGVFVSTVAIPPPTGDAALDAICLRALARAPGDRHATAAALRDDLARYRGDDDFVITRVSGLRG